MFWSESENIYRGMMFEQENFRRGMNHSIYVRECLICQGRGDTPTHLERGFDCKVDEHDGTNQEIERLKETVVELQRKQAELAMHAEMFRLLAENSLDGFWRLDHQFCFVYVSPAAENILGFSCEEIAGRSLFEFLAPESVETVKRGYAQRQPLQEQKAGWGSSVYTVEMVHKDGHHIWVEVAVNPIFDSEKRLTGYNGVTRDINERRLREEAIRRYAFYDPLTNLPNRRLFEEVLGRTLEQNGPQRRPLAVLFLDVDGLKKVNDQYGHGFGDILLQVVAERFRHAVRQEDFVARLAGDEFMVILQDIGERSEIDYIAERLVASCRQPIRLGSNQACVGVSIGVSFFPADADNVPALMSCADQAMYRAKGAGGACYVCYGQGG